MMPYGLDPYHLVAADAVMPVQGAEGFIEKAAWPIGPFIILLDSTRVVVPATSTHSSNSLCYIVFPLFQIIIDTNWVLFRSYI